jgi:hypothetical protein
MSGAGIRAIALKDRIGGGLFFAAAVSVLCCKQGSVLLFWFPVLYFCLVVLWGRAVISFSQP